MSHGYEVAGRTSAATAATLNLVIAQFWNPHATARLRVSELHICNQSGATVGNLSIQRSTARGATPAVTVTPDIDNNLDRTIAPPSGAVLELAATFGTPPTLDTSRLRGWTMTAAVGAGVIYTWASGLVIPPGTGLCVVNAAAVAFPISDVTVCWDE